MKRVLTGLLLVFCMAIAACGNFGVPTAEVTATPSPQESVAQVPSPIDSPIPAAPSTTEAQASITVGGFTLDEIYDLGAIGCGMTLWRADAQSAAPGERVFTLVNGIEEDSMLMKLNGEVIRFRRIEHSGEEFFDQYEEQTFQNNAQDIIVKVVVAKSETMGEIESIAIPSGTITVTMGGEVVEIPVEGDAGC